MTPPADTTAGFRLTEQMLRFAVIGTLGFLVDTATVYAAHFAAGIGLYGAGVLGFLVAASFTWAMNRRFTFPEARAQARGPQWLRFVATQAIGFAVNRGTYAALIAVLPPAREHPVLAVAAGSIAGMGVNFVTARQIAFRTGTGRATG
ncbi:MAG: GtrA family protein [Acetobacteraceae bacterium]